MRATIIHGERDVRLEEVPDPVLSTGRDAIVRVTSTARRCSGVAGTAGGRWQAVASRATATAVSRRQARMGGQDSGAVERSG